MAREQLSKKVRFNVFKRDLFVCQYCGRHPPEVVLEVDHINPVSAGGDNSEHNLITACFDCNRGKSAGTLQPNSLDVAGRAVELEERLEQAKAYDKLLRKERRVKEANIDAVAAPYEALFPGWTINANGRRSVGTFLKSLPPSEVIEAMEMACERKPREFAFKYFCGICWRKIKGE